MLVKAGAIPGSESISVVGIRGSDCTGTHGTNNRTYTVSSTAADEIVFVQGAYLHPTADYTKATVAEATQYTFVNKIYDQFYIRIHYWA